MTPVAAAVAPHWLDFGFAGVVLFTGLLGLMRGFTREVLSLACWMGATALSWAFYPALQGALVPYLKNPHLRDPVAMGLIFLVAMVVLKIIVHWVSGMIKATLLAGLDRTLGFVFGVVKGACILCASYAFVIFVMSDRPEFVRKSRLEPALAWGGVQLLKHIPPQALEHFSASQTKKILGSGLTPEPLDNKKIFELLMQSTPHQEDPKAPSAALPEDVGDFLTKKPE